MNISKITVDSSTHALRPYGECTTATATAEKVVTCTDFTTLYTGATILVKFASANSASAPTLNVNGTGAKNVILSGSIPVTALSGLCEFVYNGTGWVVLSTGRVAALDTNGKISSSVLPSYVDDVIEGYYSGGKFYKEKEHTTAITGTSGVVYVDITNNSGDVYRYSGSTFIKITSSPDHTHSISLTADVGSSTNGTTSVATGGHTHTITFNSFNPTGTTDANSTDIETVSKSTHTHSVSITGNTLENTASVDVPTSDHTHKVTATGSIGTPTQNTTAGDQITKVASAGHKHIFKGSQASTGIVSNSYKVDVAAQGHEHTFTGTEAPVPASAAKTTVASSNHTHTGSTSGSAKATSENDVITASVSAGVLTIKAPHTHTISATSIKGTTEVAALNHTHLFTPAGKIATTTTEKVVATSGEHKHSYTPVGEVQAPATDTAENFVDVASAIHKHLFTGTAAISEGPSLTTTAAAVSHTHGVTISATADKNTTAAAVVTVSKSNHTHTFTGSAVTPSIKTQSVSGTVNVPSTEHKHSVTVSGSTGSSTDK